MKDSNELLTVDGLTVYRAQLTEYMQALADQFLGIQLADANSSQYAGILKETGRKFFPYNALTSDPEALNSVADYYLLLCMFNSKLPAIVTFCDFANINFIPWKNPEKLNPELKLLHKKIITARENTLKNKCYDSNSVIGQITLGNTEFFWNNYGLKPYETGNALTLESLQSLDLTTKDSKGMLPDRNNTIDL